MTEQRQINTIKDELATAAKILTEISAQVVERDIDIDDIEDHVDSLLSMLAEVQEEVSIGADEDEEDEDEEDEDLDEDEEEDEDDDDAARPPSKPVAP